MCVHKVKHKKSKKKPRYQVDVIIREKVVPAFADTGADINVMSYKTASKLKIPLKETKTKVRPYGSRSLECAGYYDGTVSIGDAFSVARFYVIEGMLKLF